MATTASTATALFSRPTGSAPYLASSSSVSTSCHRRRLLGIRCQSTSVDKQQEPKAKRSLLDNTSNLLTNVLSCGSLGNMPIAEGAVTDLFGKPLFFSLYDWFLELGSVYKLAFGPKSFVVVSDPIVARHILIENVLLR